MGKLKITAIGLTLAAVAGLAFVVVTNREAISDIPGLGGLITQDPTCPLSGLAPQRTEDLERPAVAVKIENASIAYPLAGLDEAEIVYEELVEGGATRFMAIYHCTDSAKAGPVRSARMVDAAIVMPITRILAYSGANDTVQSALGDSGLVQLDEDVADGGLVRDEGSSLSFEHTLFANTPALRKLGKKTFSEPPPSSLFSFGDMDAKGKRATNVTITFSAGNVVDYAWSDDGWLRGQNGSPFMSVDDSQVTVTNVLIEEHVVNLSDIVDVNGTASPEIADVTGSGRAVLFRDGRAYFGRWFRDSIDAPVVFKTKSGDDMVLAPGSTWIELVPSNAGEVKGSFSFAK